MKRKTIDWSKISKYELYENSVQDAADDAEIFDELYRKIRKKRAKIFREDFCGTFKVACEWVKLKRDNQSLALDIDPEPLEYGREYHFSKLNEQQKARMIILQKNVISVTTPKSDIISASNFSYWIFKERELLIRYFRKVRDSLKRNGLFFLDIVGGTEMIDEHTDREKYKLRGKQFTYIWRQESFNAVTNEGFFSISYRLPNGKKWNRAFTYDWRVWSIPEIRECLAAAGFKKTWIYWEKDDKDGQGTGEFYKTEREENCPVWIAYIIASPATSS